MTTRVISIWIVAILPIAATTAAAQNLTWIRQFGGGCLYCNSEDSTQAVASADSGGVYVGGSTGSGLAGPNLGGSDAWVARYGAASTPLWIRQFGTAQYDGVRAAASDGSDGVYVVGSTGGSLGAANSGGSDAWLGRLDSGGNQSWLRQFGTSASDSALCAAPDGQGGVYLAGATMGALGGPYQGGTGFWFYGGDAWLARYDSAGNQTWIRQLGTSGNDEANAIASDGVGGAFVAGSTAGSLGGPFQGGGVPPSGGDAWLAHYDAAGNQTWILQLGSSADDYLRTAAPDGSGGVFLGGDTEGDLGATNPGGRRAWLARFDRFGNQAWIRQFGTGAGEVLYGSGADGCGGVYVCGTTGGSLGAPNVGSADAWLARFDGAGVQTWVRQRGSSGADLATAIAAGGTGAIYLGGPTDGNIGGWNPYPGTYDAWVARYDTPAAVSYCTSGISSSLCVPSISGTGAPSASAAAGFDVAVSSVDGQRQGLIFYGVDNTGFAPAPWGTSGAYLCVKAPTQRTPIQNSGGTLNTCNGALTLDWNAFRAANPAALGAPFGAGQHVYAQGWFRDPPSPKSTMLSNALEFVLQP